MASPHLFHERASAVSDTGPVLFPTRVRDQSGDYAFCPLAASLDSMARMAS
jgi:hypothetical protein